MVEGGDREQDALTFAGNYTELRQMIRMAVTRRGGPSWRYGGRADGECRIARRAIRCLRCPRCRRAPRKCQACQVLRPGKGAVQQRQVGGGFIDCVLNLRCSHMLALALACAPA